MAEPVVVTTAVPAVTITDTGLAIPDELDILNGRLSDLDTAMGGGMSKSLTTPQGQIAMSDAAIIAAKNDELAELFNMINPDYSQGRFQEGIARIYFIDRIPATGTLVTATCTGLVGTTIPANSIAQDSAGYLYFSVSDAVIPSSGAVDVIFQNQATGPIACPIGALNSIYRAVIGWSNVNNATAGVLGNDVESRANFEFRRKQSVAQNARNTLNAIKAKVLSVDGVSDAYVTSNNTAVAKNVGVSGYTLLPNSIYVGLYGGRPEDIAESIWISAPPGPDLNGNTEYTIIDKENYSPPYPEYVIKWQTATSVNVSITVYLKASEFLPSDIINLVKSSVQDAFNGNDGGSRARIGSSVYAGRYYSGIYSIDPSNVNILNLNMSRDGATFSSSLSFGIDEIPTLDSDNIIVNLVE